MKHGENISFQGMVQQVETNIQRMAMMLIAGIQVLGKQWVDMVNILGSYKPKIYHHIVY